MVVNKYGGKGAAEVEAIRAGKTKDILPLVRHNAVHVRQATIHLIRWRTVTIHNHPCGVGTDVGGIASYNGTTSTNSSGINHDG